MPPMANAAPDALRFYGVVDVEEANGHHAPVDGVTVVRFRDLGAVVAPTRYVRVQPGDEELTDYVRVVDELYAHGPVLPAPPGTVFRNARVLQTWLELHHAKLHEALGVVEQRRSPHPPYDFVRMELGA